MKTNQILTRQMGDFFVNQRTSDGMFNATELLKQWNAKSGQNKELKKFFDNSSTKEFITALISEEDLNGEKSAYLKSRGKYSGGTWMHPLLFIDFAMWLNPAFKVKVLKFVYDQLIRFRNEDGNSYSKISSSISRIVRKDFVQSAIINIAKANNHIVYGSHERNIRNKQAEESSMQELCKLQNKISELIDDGFINDYDLKHQFIAKAEVTFLKYFTNEIAYRYLQRENGGSYNLLDLLNFLRREWAKKYQPKVLAV